MGMTAFMKTLETNFLNQLEPEAIPKHLDPRDWDAVQTWFKDAFGFWFLERRDELLGREWARRGWADVVLRPTESGRLKEFFRLKPECVETVDAWLQDQLE